MARTPLKGRPVIAVIEDDDSVRRALSRLVRSLGMEVEAFASGREFLERLRPPLPDCLVLDLLLPDLNGLEVQSRIAGLGLRLPIVFVSASARSADRRVALAGGAMAFLTKPFTDRQLLSAIHSAIKTRKSLPPGVPLTTPSASQRVRL